MTNKLASVLIDQPNQNSQVIMQDESRGVTVGDDGSPRLPNSYPLKRLAFDEDLVKVKSIHLLAAMVDWAEAPSRLPKKAPEKEPWLERLTSAFANQDMNLIDPKALDTVIIISERAFCPSEDASENALSRIRHFMLLLSRYEHRGISDGLERGFDTARQAVECLPSDDIIRGIYRTMEVKKSWAHFKRTSNIGDLDRTIAAIREALSSCELEKLDRCIWTSRLATFLAHRFKVTRNSSDIEEAISNAQQAIATHSDGSIPIPQLHLLLGMVCEIKSRHTGSIEDLGKSIRAMEKAIELISDQEPKIIVLAYLSLISCLQQRFDVTENLEDLKRAINNFEHVLSLGTELEALLTDFACMKLRLFRRTSQPNDLKQAIEAFSSAESKLPQGHPERPRALTNMALAFNATGTIEGINTAIEKAQEAVEAIPENHADLSAQLNTVGLCFAHQYCMTQVEGYLDKAIQFFKQANSNAIGDSHVVVQEAIYSANLGICLDFKYEASRDTKYRDEALQCFTSLIKNTLAPHWRRIHAARAALRSLARERDWAQAEEILNIALELLPHACNRHMSREDQQYSVQLASGLAADACSLSLQHGKVEEAIQRAEMGRGIILSHLMDNRADLSLLRKLHCGLAKEYEDVRNMAFQSVESEDFVVREGLFRKREKARERMRHLETEIRKKPELRFFLQSPPVKVIQQNASEGPIVIVNVTDISSDAIIITDSTISTVNLSAMTSQPPKFFAQDLRNYRSEGKHDFGHRNFVHEHLQDND